MEREITLATLHELDLGRPGVAFENHIRAAAADCYDRPLLRRPRKVTITVELSPVTNEGGDCEKIAVGVQLANKLPAHVAGVTLARAGLHGNLAFQTEAPEDPAQTTIDQELQRNGLDG